MDVMEDIYQELGTTSKDLDLLPDRFTMTKLIADHTTSPPAIIMSVENMDHVAPVNQPRNVKLHALMVTKEAIQLINGMPIVFMLFHQMFKKSKPK